MATSPAANVKFKVAQKVEGVLIKSI